MAKKRKGWFLKGAAGEKREKREQKRAAARSKLRGLPRFWLSHDESAPFTFLDDPIFFIYEHNLQINGKYGNFVTCLRCVEDNECPACDDEVPRSYVRVGTVISHKKWRDNKGKLVKNQKVMLPMKSKASKFFKRQLKKRGSLVGCTFEAYRGDDRNSPQIGEEFEFKGKKSKEELLKLVPKDIRSKGKKAIKEFLQPFNFEEKLYPLEEDELRSLLGLAEDTRESDDDLDADEDEKEVKKARKKKGKKSKKHKRSMDDISD